MISNIKDGDFKVPTLLLNIPPKFCIWIKLEWNFSGPKACCGIILGKNVNSREIFKDLLFISSSYNVANLDATVLVKAYFGIVLSKNVKCRET